jgi:tetratricopeptide (TPR) repeat protein
MSKPMLVTVPFVLLLLDFWPFKRVTGDEWRVTRFGLAVPQPSIFNRLLLEKLPFVVLSLISSLITLRAQGDAGFIIHVAPLPWYVRVIISPVFYMAYLGKIFWPENLAIFYPYPLVYPWQLACSGLLWTGLSVFCLRQARSRAYLFVGWFWFLVMLVPVIGLVQVGTQSIADRYMYLPSIGLFMAVAWGLAEMAARSRLWRTGMTLAATAVGLACLLDTRYQLRYWRDSATLFSHALEVTRENNSMSYYGLGNALWKSGDLDGAVRNYRAALRLAPNLTEASSRLGYILLQQNKPAEAEVEFKGVLRLDPSDTKAHKYLGDALATQGKLAAAEAEYAAVLQLNPGNAVIYEALKPDMEKLATAKALTNLYETLKVQPTPEIHVQIAGIQTTQRDFQGAVGHYLAALQLKPDAPDILNNLAWLLATCQDDHVRNGAQSVQYAQRACELTQNQQPMMLGTLAAAYAEAGRFDEAVATAQKACNLAAQQDETNLLQKNQALLELYRAHKPWRE